MASRNYLNTRKRIRLLDEVREFIAEDRRPFSHMEEAADGFTAKLGFVVTASNLRKIIRDGDIDESMISRRAATGSLSPEIRDQISDLATRVARFEALLERMEDRMRYVEEAIK